MRPTPSAVLAAAERDAFVELLRDPHGALGRHAQTVRGVLLQLRGRVRSRRFARGLALRDALDLVVGDLEVRHVASGVLLVEDRQPRADLVELLAVDALERCHERMGLLALEARVDEPVVDRNERITLVLAVDDDAKRGRLNPPGRKPKRELLPQQARKRIAADAVEHAASALRLVEVRIEVPRLVEALLDAALGDLFEQDALDLGFLVGLLRHLHEVVGNRLALAVGVGCEQDLVGLLGGGPDRFDDLGLPLLLEELVGFLEALLDVDASLLGEVLDVAFGREHLVAVTDVLLDGLRLGRGLHDEEDFGHRSPLVRLAATSASLVPAPRLLLDQPPNEQPQNRLLNLERRNSGALAEVLRMAGPASEGLENRLLGLGQITEIVSVFCFLRGLGPLGRLPSARSPIGHRRDARKSSPPSRGA